MITLQDAHVNYMAPQNNLNFILDDPCFKMLTLSSAPTRARERIVITGQIEATKSRFYHRRRERDTHSSVGTKNRRRLVWGGHFKI